MINNNVNQQINISFLYGEKISNTLSSMFGSEAKSLIIEKFSMTLKSQGEFIYTFERKWNEVKRSKEKFMKKYNSWLNSDFKGKICCA